MTSDSVGIILLAAGASVRMGEPKQLLQFQGETFLRRMTKVALGVSGKIVVTLGANIEVLRNEVEDLPVQIAENKNWKTGMSGSIKAGLEKLSESENKIEAVILTVCDQPLVDEKLLEKLIENFERTDSLIVACAYQNTFGVPALFRRKLFPELLALSAESGAKQLIEKYQRQTTFIEFPEGAFDVDTAADFENLTKNFRR